MNQPSFSEEQTDTDHLVDYPAVVAENKSSLWPKLLGGILVGGGLLVGGFYLGSNYQVVWPQSWPFMPELVSTGNGKNITNDPLYAQVEQLMRSKYLRSDELNNEAMLYGAISGMVASANDPYTAFFDPEQNQASQEQLSGHYSGIGAELGYNEDKQIVVVAPIKGTPAEQAGLIAGDMVVSVDDKSTDGLTLNEVVTKIRGEAGSQVKLGLLSKDASASHDLTITRQQITIKTVEVEYRDDVAYVTLSRFGENTESEWNTVVTDIISKGSKSMILDMRNNPGGYLDTAITIGSEFFKDGIIVGQQDASGRVQNFEATGRGRLTNIKVVVLVNQGSASAAEIVSGALQSRQRAKVVGVTSFGKGSVQQVIELPRHTSLHVTIAKWVLPNGQNIDKQGIKPEVEVKMTSEDVQNKQDPQLDKALELAKSQ